MGVGELFLDDDTTEAALEEIGIDEFSSTPVNAMGVTSKPISSIGSRVSLQALHDSHLTLLSTTPRNNENGYSLS